MGASSFPHRRCLPLSEQAGSPGETQSYFLGFGPGVLNHFHCLVLIWRWENHAGWLMLDSLMKLAVEANAVVALRMMKLMLGGRNARREAELMVREKLLAGIEASANLMAGASTEEIVHRYRHHVAANAKRLSRRKTRRSSLLKRPRRRRK